MSIIRSAIMLGALTAIAVSAMLQQAASEDSEHPNPVRRTDYTQDDAPLGVRLKVFLLWFTIDNPDKGLFIKQYLSEGGFPPESYDELIDYFQGLRDRIEAEIDLEMWRMACDEDASKLNGVQIRALWNAFEDLRNGTYHKYLAVPSADLATLGHVDFPERLQRMDMHFGDVGFDYRDDEIVSDEDLFELRIAICKQLESRVSAESEVCS